MTGTPSGSPAVPAVPANSLVLAEVLVPATSGAVTITDRRPYATAVGGIHRIRSAAHRPTTPARYPGMRCIELDTMTEIQYYGSGVWEIVSEGATVWNPTFSQPGAIPTTYSYGRRQRQRGWFHAQAQIVTNGPGIAGNYISIDLPYTIADVKAVHGTYWLDDVSATRQSEGSIKAINTTRVAFVEDGATGSLTNELLGDDPVLTIATGDILHVTLHGFYA